MPPSTPEHPSRLEIRKYPNRRYYDTTRSRHVTLEQIYALIREGYEIQVIDSKTGTDITPKILAQIIIELDASKLGVFPVPMLHRLLQANQEMVNEFVQKYFNQPLSSFLDSQRSMEQYFRQAMGLKQSPGGVSEWTKLVWGPLNPSFWTDERTQVPDPPAPAASSVTGDDSSALRSQVELLSRQVEQLQRQQPSSGPKKPRRPR